MSACESVWNVVFLFIFLKMYLLFIHWKEIWKDHFVCAQFAPSKGKSPVSFRADRIEDRSKIHIYFLSLKPFPGKITFHGLKSKRGDILRLEWCASRCEAISLFVYTIFAHLGSRACVWMWICRRNEVICRKKEINPREWDEKKTFKTQFKQLLIH